jgi:hypothetical protein
MSTCDVMLVLPGWKNSEGTKAEITEAQKQKKFIFYTLKELSDWLVDDARKFAELCIEDGAPNEHVCAKSCDVECVGNPVGYCVDCNRRNGEHEAGCGRG